MKKMQISKIYCDRCGQEYNYPIGQFMHYHPELEIGGVPMNIWTPIYDLKKGPLKIDYVEQGIMRFKAYLPAYENIYSLGEGMTPLQKLIYPGSVGEVYLKDESHNPTFSFKDRGMPLLIADVLASGKDNVAIPSTGNAAVSLVRYAQLADITATVFIPHGTSESKKNMLGSSCIIEDSDLIESFEHFFRYCKSHKEVYNGFPVTNIPYMMGIRTMAFELYEQLGNAAPDWIIIPAGSGGNAVSQYMGFFDLMRIGLIKTMPKFVSVQIKGADPITVGYMTKSAEAVILENLVESNAEAISSDTSFNYHKLIKILNDTKGIAISVTDNELEKEIEIFSSFKLEYSSFSVFAAFQKIKPFIRLGEKIVLIGTAGVK